MSGGGFFNPFPSDPVFFSPTFSLSSCPEHPQCVTKSHAPHKLSHCSCSPSARLAAEFEKPYGQIPHCRHRMGTCAARYPADILSECFVTPVVRSNHYRRPMGSHRLQNLPDATYLLCQTRHSISVFLHFFHFLSSNQTDAFTKNQHDLPAACQPDILRCHRQALYAPAAQPAVALFPLSGVFRGKKTPSVTEGWLVPVSPTGCL